MARESASERQDAKVRKKGAMTEERRRGRPLSSSHGVRSTGPFFLFAFHSCPSRLPLPSLFPSFFVFLVVLVVFVDTRWLHACTYVRTYVRVLRLLRSLLVRPLSSLVLLAFSPLVHLHLLRRRTFVRVPVHSFVETPLAFSGHVAHAARKCGGDTTRRGHTVLVETQVKVANGIPSALPLCSSFVPPPFAVKCFTLSRVFLLLYTLDS